MTALAPWHVLLVAGVAAVLAVPAARYAAALGPSARATDALLVGTQARRGRWAGAVALGCAGAAAVSWWDAQPPLRPLTAWTCAALVVLAATDLRTGRLPDRLVATMAAGCTVLVALAEHLDPSAGDLGAALLAAAAVFAGSVAVAVALPGTLGMGDAKLLAPVALAVGYSGGLTAFWWVLAAVSVPALVLVTRAVPAGGRRVVPFGPAVCTAAVLVLWAG